MDLYSSNNALEIFMRTYFGYKKKRNNPKYKTFVRFLASNLPIKPNLRIYSKVKNKILYLDLDEYLNSFTNHGDSIEDENSQSDELLLNQDINEIFDRSLRRNKPNNSIEFDYYDDVDLYPLDSKHKLKNLRSSDPSTYERSVAKQQRVLNRFDVISEVKSHNSINKSIRSSSQKGLDNSYFPDEKNDDRHTTDRITKSKLDDVENALSMIMTQLQILTKQVESKDAKNVPTTSDSTSTSTPISLPKSPAEPKSIYLTPKAPKEANFDDSYQKLSNPDIFNLEDFNDLLNSSKLESDISDFQSKYPESPKMIDSSKDIFDVNSLNKNNDSFLESIKNADSYQATDGLFNALPLPEKVVETTTPPPTPEDESKADDLSYSTSDADS